MTCEFFEAWDLVCMIIDGEHQLSDIDTMEWPMAAMDMPTGAAVWDKRESMAIDVVEARNDLYHNRCLYPCHNHHNHYCGHHD